MAKLVLHLPPPASEDVTARSVKVAWADKYEEHDVEPGKEKFMFDKPADDDGFMIEVADWTSAGWLVSRIRRIYDANGRPKKGYGNDLPITSGGGRPKKEAAPEQPTASAKSNED